MNNGRLAGFGAIGLGLTVIISIQMVGIQDPLTDAHAWRQTDTAAIARNFFRDGYSFLYPEVDWGGSGPYFIESEFPLVPYVTANLYRFAGLHDYVGRLVSMTFSAGTAIMVYLLAVYYFGTVAGWFAVWALALSPIFLFFGRAFISDGAMLFFSVLFLYLGCRWLDGGARPSVWICAVAGALAFLLKPTALAMLGPLGIVALWTYGWGAFRRPSLIALLALTVAPAVLWYLHAADLHAQTGLTFDIWNFAGGKFANVRLLSDPQFYLLIAQRLAGQVISRYAVWLSLLGLVLPGASAREKRGRGLLVVWGAALVFSLLAVAEGNALHEYYQLPFVPLMAIGFGRSITWLKARLGTAFAQSPWQRGVQVVGLLLFIGYMLGGMWSSVQFYDIIFRQAAFHSNNVVYSAAQSVASVTQRTDLLVVAYEEVRLPELFYYADRKGWVVNYQRCDPAEVSSKAALGARYVILVLSVTNPHPTEPGECGLRFQAQFAPVARGPYWFLYRIG